MRRVLLGTLVVLGILAPVTLVPARGEKGPGEREFPVQSDTIVIQIVADADSVRAEPDVVTVLPGQFVTWTTELGDWQVNFRSEQPFGDQAVGDGIRGNRGQRNPQRIRPDAEAGRYKYDILVRIQGERTLRADPEIIVAPRGYR